MTEKEKEIIRDLSKCGFKEIDAHFKLMSEQRKARSKEEKKAEKVIQYKCPRLCRVILVEMGWVDLDLIGSTILLGQ